MSRKLLSPRNVNHRFIGFLPKVQLYRLMAATDSVWSLQWLALLKSSTLYFDKTSMIFFEIHILYGENSGFPNPTISWYQRLRKKILQMV